jgi:RNA polymerase sigma-70 factor, ECF subfamily
MNVQVPFVMWQGKQTQNEMREASDECGLVAQAKSGCASAFGQLYERHRVNIYHMVLRVVRQREDAEDAVQRCFQQAFTNLGRFRGESRFSTWVSRIAINEALMILRKKRARMPLSETSYEDTESPFVLNLTDGAPNPEQAVAADELRSALIQAFFELRNNLRTVIVLREFQGLTNKETAQRLGLSVAAVKTRVFHARRWLPQRLERKLKPTSR